MVGRVVAPVVGLLVAFVGKATVSPEEVARQFVPGGFGGERVDVAAVVTRFGTEGGRRYIVAYYVTPEKAALRVLEERSESWTVKHTSDLPTSSCVSDPNLSLRDLDRDGRPEVTATCTEFPGNRSATEVYRWIGAALVDAVASGSDEIVGVGAAEFGDVDADDLDEIVPRYQCLDRK